MKNLQPHLWGVGGGQGVVTRVTSQAIKKAPLDEADELLSPDRGDGEDDRDFGQDITYIVRKMRPHRQVLLSSATWPERVEELAD